ncbi:MAG: hypothetical protein HY537_03365 [Deltaproteobacteria bacterium]|nr:hypothetical protein [Deltaproteobacteria bacterium]
MKYILALLITIATTAVAGEKTVCHVKNAYPHPTVEGKDVTITFEGSGCSLKRVHADPGNGMIVDYRLEELVINDKACMYLAMGSSGNSAGVVDYFGWGSEAKIYVHLKGVWQFFSDTENCREIQD